MSLRAHPSPRRLPVLAVGVLLAAPLLASCGFDLATDRVNTISAGVNDREGQVDVLGAVVIAGEDDLGLFVATLVNNSGDAPSTFTGLGEDEVTAAEPATPLEVPAAGRASFFDTGGIAVTGTFTAGDFVEVTLTFENGQVTSLTVPVEVPCQQYSPENLPDLELPTAAEAGAEEENVPEGETGRYSCEAAEPVEHGEPAEEPVEPEGAEE